MDESEARAQAIKRIKAKRAFLTHLVTYLVVNLLVWLIWAVGDGGFPWPIFVTFGWGIGLASNAWAVYGVAKPITDADIQREMQRGTDNT